VSDLGFVLTAVVWTMVGAALILWPARVRSLTNPLAKVQELASRGDKVVVVSRYRPRSRSHGRRADVRVVQSRALVDERVLGRRTGELRRIH
jgi:hypothetical protein